jgi:hypothetical protein
MDGSTLLGNSFGNKVGTRGPKIDRMRHDRAELAAVLSEHGSLLHGDSCRCPFPARHKHGDRNRSAGIYQNAEGAWRVRCFPCNFDGDVFDLLAALAKRPLGDVLREHDGEHRANGRQPPSTNGYHEPDLPPADPAGAPQAGPRPDAQAASDSLGGDPPGLAPSELLDRLDGVNSLPEGGYVADCPCCLGSGTL